MPGCERLQNGTWTGREVGGLPAVGVEFGVEVFEPGRADEAIIWGVEKFFSQGGSKLRRRR
jgi:hypothetical protein